jgi:hypothetical protein|nr:MAG TPA: hypothetical protein [Caudoviricetes sp.]
MTPEILIEEIAGGFRQMTAPDGYYITQAGEVNELQRLFVRRRTLLASEQPADWRIATASEQQTHERRMDAGLYDPNHERYV